MAKLARALGVAATLALLFGPGPAAAERVGINSAVNPNATGTPPSAQPRRLVIGGNVLYQERIATGDKGQTQILFVDQSTMSVGPNSNLVIDQFVYNPHAGTGKMVANLTRGIFRYVGGRLSKHDNSVQFTTPAATIGIRGGIVLIDVGTACPAGASPKQVKSGSCGMQVVFVYGKGVTVTGRDGSAKTATRPGFEITVARPGDSPSNPIVASPGLIELALAALDGRAGGTGGATVAPTDPMVVKSGIPIINSEDFQTSVQVAQASTLNQPPTGQLQPVDSAPVRQAPSPSEVASPAPLPPPINSPTLQIQTSSSQSQPIVVDAITQPPSPTPTPTPPPPVVVTYAGVFKNTAGAGSFLDQGASGAVPARIAYANGQLSNGIFSVDFGTAGTLSIPLALGSASLDPATASSPLGPVSGSSFMTADGTFFYADLTPTDLPAEREFIDGGLPVSTSFFQPTPQTRFFAFDLQPDAALQSGIPFIRAQAGGSLANATVSPLYVVASPLAAFGGSVTTSGFVLQPTRALQASLAIDGQGASQSSVLSMAVGGISQLASTSAPVLSGLVRGSSLLSAGGTPLRIGSSLATVIDGNQNSFYGGSSISGFALDQTALSPSATNPTGVAIDSGAAEVPLSPTTSPTAYGFVQPAIAGSLLAGIGSSRSAGLLTGYFGGLMVTTAQSTPYAVAGLTALQLDPNGNHVFAVFNGNDPLSAQTSGISSIQLSFGNGAGTAAGNDAYIDYNIFGAAESTSSLTPQQINGQTLVVGGSTAQAAKLYLLSSGVAPPPSSLLPSGVSYCTCQYLRWGYWGGDLRTGNSTDSTISRVDRGHINFWEAGQLTPYTDLQTLAGQNVTGIYNGHLIGSVFNGGNQYVAAGGLQMTFNFATLDGSFAVNNFDGTSFTQAIPAQSVNAGQYTFSVNQSGLTGGVNGAFYGQAAAETGGNFYWHNAAQSYIASGIFAARR